jgi:hypothetical protein
MSLFDKITQTLDTWLSAPETARPGDDEQAHMDLLEQSSARIRETVDAIRKGNLIAASSTTEDIRAADLLRYEELQMRGKTSTHIGAIAETRDNGMTHVERLNASRARAAEQSNGRIH